MKKFVLRLSGLMVLLCLVIGLQAQSNADATDAEEIVIVQKIKHDDGSVTTVKKRVAKGDKLESYWKEFNSVDGSNVDVYIVNDTDTDVEAAENAEVEIKEGEGETVFFFRRAKEHKEAAEEMHEEMRNLSEEMESMRIIINNDVLAEVKDFDSNYDWKGHELHGDHEEPRLLSKKGKKAFLGIYPGNTEDNVGVKVSGVVSGKGAEAGGIEKGDVILTIGGHETNGTYGLRSALYKVEPGETVPVEILRDGQRMQKVVTLGEREVTRWYLNEERDPCEVFIGVYTTTHSSSRGLRVTSIIGNTPAETYGIEAGDQILALDKVDVNTHTELRTERDRHEPGEWFTLTVKRNDEVMDIEAQFKTCPTDEEIEALQEEEVIEEVIVEEPIEEPVNDLPQFDAQDFALELTEFSAYPNPTFGRVNINFKAPAVPTSIQLSDATGRVVHKEQLNNFDGFYNKEINLKEVTPGTLTLTISQGDKIVSKQLILLARA